MNKHEKKVSNLKIIKDLRVEIAGLRQENRLLKAPLYQMDFSFRKLNEMLRELIRDDFFFTVDMACTGEYRICFRWDQAESERCGYISDRELTQLIRRLRFVDWDAEMERDFEMRKKVAIEKLERELADEKSAFVNSRNFLRINGSS